MSMESEFAGLSLDEEEEEILRVQVDPESEYDGSSLGKENINFMRISVQIDIRRLLKRKKQVMFKSKCSYVRFK
ncbi:hypothetical protein Gotri_011533 [Gossypium trilobum]|uniref:Uncharacterized protein n=1 Tax=Gossypium trilobum TaxID=34281 RepID=A0A7J9EU36_9ROSI|nr:hypothetical protein [Gossypium trilobum]